MSQDNTDDTTLNQTDNIVEEQSISTTDISDSSIVISPINPQSDLPTFTFPLTSTTEALQEPSTEDSDVTAPTLVENLSKELVDCSDSTSNINSQNLPQLHLTEEFQIKEVTSIETHFYNVYVMFQNNLYTLLNDGTSLEKIIERFLENMNTSCLVINKNITVEHKQNIKISIDNIEQSTLMNFKLNFGFSGPKSMLNFIDFKNLIDKEKGIKCIVTVEINDDIQSDILIEKEYFIEIIKNLNQRIDSENKKIKDAFNFFIGKMLPVIENRYNETQLINKTIRQNFI